MRIKMVGIPVTDPVKAFKHYTEVLGFKELMYDPGAQLCLVVSHDDPKGTSIILEPNGNPISKNFQTSLYEAGIPIITLCVDNLKEEHLRLVNLDVKFKKEPKQESWGWDSVFDDGFGNWIQLMQDL